MDELAERLLRRLVETRTDATAAWIAMREVEDELEERKKLFHAAAGVAEEADKALNEWITAQAIKTSDA